MSHQQRGMTLIELVVALAIAAITLTLALPAFDGLMDRTHASTMHNQIVAAFNHARLLALTQRANAVVCPSQDQSSCRSDGIWDDGWITFVDIDANNQRNAAEMVLKVDSPDSDALHIRSSVYRSRARFRPNGMAYGSNLTLRLCGRQNEVVAALVLNNAGRARSASAAEIAQLSDC